MKKLLFFFGALLITSSTFAQFEYGVKAGANASYLTHSELDIKTGVALGGFLNYRFNKTLSLGTELMFSQQGVKIREEGRFLNESMEYNTADYYKAYKLNYLNIPLMAKVNLYKGFYTNAGVQMGILLQDIYKLDVEGMDEHDKKTSLSDYKDVTPMDFGMNVGLGYEHKSGLVLDVRYNLGFINALKNETDKHMNSVFQATVGYRFGKTKSTED